MEVKQPIIRTRYNYDRDLHSRMFSQPREIGEDPSLTQQQFKDECDINYIMAQFGKTNKVPTTLRVPTYGDFSGVGDYQTAMNVLVATRESFMQLPAKLRERFHNDPQEFLTFVEDKENLEESYKLGIRQKPKEQPRDVVQAVDELKAAMAPAPDAK